MEGSVTISLKELDDLRKEIGEAKEFIEKFRDSDRCFLIDYSSRNYYVFPRIMANGESEIKKYFNDLASSYNDRLMTQEDFNERLNILREENKKLKLQIPRWRRPK